MREKSQRRKSKKILAKIEKVRDSAEKYKSLALEEDKNWEADQTRIRKKIGDAVLCAQDILFKFTKTDSEDLKELGEFFSGFWQARGKPMREPISISAKAA